MKVYTYFNKQRTGADGFTPIYIIIYRKGMSRLYINTGMQSKTVFNDGIFPLTERNHKAKTKRLLDIMSDIERIALENSLLSNEELKRIIMQDVFDMNINQKRLYEYVAEYGERCRNVNTASSYYVLANKIEAYDSKATLRINLVWIEDFFNELLSTCSESSSYLYISRLRAVINYHRKHTGLKNDAFLNFTFRKVPTRHRDLTLEQLREIRDAELKGNKAKYRDAFMLSFYLIGVNPVDLFNARKEQLRNGRYEYNRSKTKKEYSIFVPEEAMEIIDRYPGTTNLVSFCEHDTYRNFSHKVNYFLSNMFNGTTLYYARHTWATLAYNIDIPYDIVSDCLGHTHGTSVTGIYINKDIKKIDDASRKVLALVKGVSPGDAGE